MTCRVEGRVAFITGIARERVAVTPCARYIIRVKLPVDAACSVAPAAALSGTSD